jgi:hypothetical protein
MGGLLNRCIADALRVAMRTAGFYQRKMSGLFVGPNNNMA